MRPNVKGAVWGLRLRASQACKRVNLCWNKGARDSINKSLNVLACKTVAIYWDELTTWCIPLNLADRIDDWDTSNLIAGCVCVVASRHWVLHLKGITNSESDIHSAWVCRSDLAYHPSELALCNSREPCTLVHKRREVYCVAVHSCLFNHSAISFHYTLSILRVDPEASLRSSIHDWRR